MGKSGWKVDCQKATRRNVGVCKGFDKVFILFYLIKLSFTKILKSVKLRKDTMTLENGSKYGKRGKNDL